MSTLVLPCPENASNSLKRLHHSVRASIPNKLGYLFFVFTRDTQYRIIRVIIDIG
jgi:hypothetical protein